jgi:steroid delta-isomerase-like uncharacterized protein
MIEQNKVITARATEFWNAGDLALVDEIHATNFVNHDPSRPDVTDLESYKLFIAEVRTSMPDYQVTAQDTIAEGDKVVTRWIGNGTHQGEYVGIPPTGQHATLAGMTIYRFEAGKIAEAWWVYDSLGMMQQLGIIPSLEAA